MLALVACVLLNASILVLFRLFGRKSLPLLPIIVINYLTCTLLGWVWQPQLMAWAFTPQGGWQWLALVQGCLFITLFLSIAYSTHRQGVTRTTLLTKLSVVCPLLVALWVYAEPLTGWQQVGLGLALLAIVLMYVPLPGAGARAVPHKGSSVALSLLIFLGTGTIDSLFKVFQHHHSAHVPDQAFIGWVFATAGVVGLLALTVNLLRRPRQRLPWGLVLGAGAVLGVVNYFSVLAQTTALRSLPAAVFYPAANLGLIWVMALLGVGLFKEKLGPGGYVALAVAALSILLLV